MATVVGSLCHNDPAGDWTTVALAARAEVVIRGATGARTVPIDAFPRRQLHDGGRRRRDGARRGVPGAGRSHRRLVSEDRAQGRRLRDRRGGGADLARTPTARSAGRHRAFGRRPVRRARREAEQAAGRSEADRRPDSRGGRCGDEEERAAGRSSRKRRLQEASGWRARRARTRARPCRVWGCGHEGQRQDQRRRLRARRRAAHAARVLPPRGLRPHRHARRLRHVELRLLRRRDGRKDER